MGAGLSCGGAPEQGRFQAVGVADGQAVEIDVPVTSATLQTGSDGFLAIDVWDLEPSTGIVFPGSIGALCLWVRQDVIARTGVVDLAQPWEESLAPFTRSDWQCVPPEGVDAPIFMGIRCPVSSEETLPSDPADLTPVQVTPTPGELVPEISFPTPVPEDPGRTPQLRVKSGTLTVTSPASGVCGPVVLEFTDLVLENHYCAGPVQALSLPTVHIAVTPLPPGRDWQTGGNFSCR